MSDEKTVPGLHFFPARLPDETLHSRVSRLHTLSSNLDDRHTLQDVFGSHTLVVTSHLPSHLNALSSRLPAEVQASPEDFLEQATLFPYFRPFLQPEQVERCRAAMCSNNAGKMKVAVGLVASRIGGRSAFSFCRQCCIDDALRYGTAYWHRAHQLPGVHLCLDHGLPLVDVDENWLRSHRHNLFLPIPAQFSGSISEHSIRPNHSTCLSECATLSVQLLRSNQLPFDPSLLRSFYRDCATKQGWLDVHGRICSAAVCRAAEALRDQLPMEDDFRFISDRHWICKLLHKHRGSMHPLKHLTMLILLRSDWPSLLLYCRSHSAPSTPVRPKHPRTCPTIEIAAPCKSAPATRPKTLKGERLATLELALATTGSLPLIAQAHSVSIASLYRILRKCPAVAQQRDEQLRDTRRQRFIAELQSTPPRRAQDYMWLYRNDQAWLKLLITKLLPRFAKASQWRVDWSKRDRDLAQTIRHRAMTFYAVVPPIRVSKTIVTRSTGKQATLEKYASKLPSSMAALAEVAESIEHFQCRRLEWAARELLAGGNPPLPWQILRMAGIPFPLAPELDRTLSRLTGT